MVDLGLEPPAHTETRTIYGTSLADGYCLKSALSGIRREMAGLSWILAAAVLLSVLVCTLWTPTIQVSGRRLPQIAETGVVRLPGENVLVNHYPVYRDVLLALFDHPLYSFTPVFQELVQGYGIYSAFKDILSGGFGIGEEQRLFIKQIIASICENRNTLLSVNDYAIAPRTDDFRWSSAVIPSREFKDSITSRINYYVHPRALGGNKSIRVPFGSTGVVSRGTGESLQFKLMLLHRVSLLSDSTQSEPSHSCIHYRDVYDDPFSPEKPWQRFFFRVPFCSRRVPSCNNLGCKPSNSLAAVAVHRGWHDCVRYGHYYFLLSATHGHPRANVPNTASIARYFSMMAVLAVDEKGNPVLMQTLIRTRQKSNPLRRI